MNTDPNNLLRTAFDNYLLQLNRGELESSENYLPYDFEDIDSHQWHAGCDMMVKNELQEITNILNLWHNSLQRWQAWNEVIQPYDTNDAWEIRWEFLEALAHQCLLTPSSIRDTFIFVATNSLHQVRLMASEGYPDSLEGDPKCPDKKPKHLKRHQKEDRLKTLISIWPSEADSFMASLRKIDDGTYRKDTCDYRNLNSHSIGPRLGIGITRTVVRSVMQVSGKMSVVYGFGGTQPLDMEKACAANLEQYRRARECYMQYRNLLAAGLVSMPQKQPEK